MQLRHHPTMVGQWPPKRPVGGSYAGADQLKIQSVQLPENAVLHSVEDCPPNDSNKRVMLITDQGSAPIFTNSDPILHQYLLQKLPEYIGRSLKEIGDLKVDF